MLSEGLILEWLLPENVLSLRLSFLYSQADIINIWRCRCFNLYFGSSFSFLASFVVDFSLYILSIMSAEVLTLVEV